MVGLFVVLIGFFADNVAKLGYDTNFLSCFRSHSAMMMLTMLHANVSFKQIPLHAVVWVLWVSLSFAQI